MQTKKEHSVVVPLGSQKLYVPSERLAGQWKEKMERIQAYLALPPGEKEYKLMELSLKKFYRLQNKSIPVIKTIENLEMIFSEVCSVVELNGVRPRKVKSLQNSDQLDLIQSITATINKFFTKRDFQGKVRIQSVTEYFWHYTLDENYIFPFADDREDLRTMVEMGLPLFDETTLYHEVGSGSGEGIIDVIYRGYNADRMPGSIIGTDINGNSLESIKLLVEEEFGGLDNVYLRFGNAVDPLVGIPLGFTPKVVVMGANRFFSILEPTVFNTMLGSFQRQIGQRGFLISGITTNSRRNLDLVQQFTLLKRHGNSYSLEDCDYGKILYLKNPFQEHMEQEDISKDQLIDKIHMTTGLKKTDIDISRVVSQVYYDPAKFIEAVEKHSFKMKKSTKALQPMHDEREVVLFERV